MMVPCCRYFNLCPRCFCFGIISENLTLKCDECCVLWMPYCEKICEHIVDDRNSDDDYID